MPTVTRRPRIQGRPPMTSGARVPGRVYLSTDRPESDHNSPASAVEGLFHHVLAVLHDSPTGRPTPARSAWNGPASPSRLARRRRRRRDGDPRRIRGVGSRACPPARPRRPVDGVTTGTLGPAVAAHRRMGPARLRRRRDARSGPPHRAPVHGRRMRRARRRPPALGETTFDVHLNDGAYWPTSPSPSDRNRLGGYEALKKWPSYPDRPVRDRSLNSTRVHDTARRIDDPDESVVEWIRSRGVEACGKSVVYSGLSTRRSSIAFSGRKQMC